MGAALALGQRVTLLAHLRAVAVTASVLLAAVLTGCASVPPNAGQDPRDPLEPLNRQVFAFNDALDTAVMKPLAEVYDKVLPVPIQDCLSNAFSNLREPSNALNSLLQGKGADAANDVCRFAINTTIGLLGCFDVASRMQFEKHREDFGQTLAVWGLGDGPYLVLPFLGPSSVRDGVGLGVETFLDVNFWIENVSVRNTIFGVRYVNARHELLPADKLISGAALDKYTFVRDGYLQRRRNMVFDGNPPRERDVDDEDDKARPPKGSSGAPAADSDVKPGSAPQPAQ
jgi:phospholipid-binding lipoprotein MlaA